MLRPAPIVVIVAIIAFFVLAIGDVLTTSPTSDELPHLTAGITYLKTRDFRVNPEHPPLVKLIAASSLAGMRVWPDHFRNDGSDAFEKIAELWPATKDTVWAQWLLAHALIYAQRDGAYLNDSAAMFRRARLTLLFLTGLGLAAVIFAWSRELWGATGAAISTALFCFDPNFIAHAGLVTTDVAVSLFMTASVYFFWRSSRRFTFANVAAFAIVTALAAVTKFSSLLLIPIVLLCGAAALGGARQAVRLVVACAVALLVTVVMIWAIYGFGFDNTHGLLPIRDLKPNAIVLFANDHHLLPQSYLYGIARQRADAVRPSYLRGEKQPHGFRTYFFWTFITKTPLPTIAAIGAALFVAVRRRARGIAFLLIPAALYFIVAVVADLNIGHRHLLPMYPFLYVLCGVLSQRWLAACALSLVSCLVVFTPADAMWSHHLSYFNELARGPRHGWEIVADSNIDWGQDLPALARWLRANRVEEPIDFVYFGSADPNYYGIRYRNVNGSYFGSPPFSTGEVRGPGVLAISVTQYSGAAAATVNDWRVFVAKHRAQPVGRAGYSILIFRMQR